MVLVQKMLTLYDTASIKWILNVLETPVPDTLQNCNRIDEPVTWLGVRLLQTFINVYNINFG